MKTRLVFGIVGAAFLLGNQCSFAQEQLPQDTGLPSSSYHTSPRYRISEEHPFRIMAYVLNPIGWVVREGITRPLSYFASSTETTRSVLGFREPYDYRRPECFSADDTIPDCRSISPFNYDDSSKSDGSLDIAALDADSSRYVYFPDVNFDFNKSTLSDLGMGRVHQIANLLEKEAGLTVVLEGHSDFKGSEEFNKKLSTNRAEAVKKGLVDLGVDTARLSTVSFGEGTPVFAEQTDWARAVNRRVAVKPATPAME